MLDLITRILTVQRRPHNSWITMEILNSYGGKHIRHYTYQAKKLAIARCEVRSEKAVETEMLRILNQVID